MCLEYQKTLFHFFLNLIQVWAECWRGPVNCVGTALSDASVHAVCTIQLCLMAEWA